MGGEARRAVCSFSRTRTKTDIISSTSYRFVSSNSGLIRDPDAHIVFHKWILIIIRFGITFGRFRTTSHCQNSTFDAEQDGKRPILSACGDDPTVSRCSLQSLAVWRVCNALDRVSSLGCTRSTSARSFAYGRIQSSAMDNDAGNVGAHCFRLEGSERLELRATVRVASFGTGKGALIGSFTLPFWYDLERLVSMIPFFPFQ